MIRTLRIVVWSVLLLSIFVDPSAAAVIYTASTSGVAVGGAFGDSTTTSDPFLLQAFSDQGNAFAIARADENGFIGASAAAGVVTQTDPENNPNGPSGASASANVRKLGEIMFSGPGDTVFTSMFFTLDGALDVDDDDPLTAGSSLATIHVAVTLKDLVTFQIVNVPDNNGHLHLDTQLHEGAGGIQNPDDGVRIPFITGVFRGTQPSDPLVFNHRLFETGAFQVSTGVRYQLTHSLTVGAETNIFFASSDFDQSMGLPIDAPVFDLPAGYTVNSPDFNIVNNQFVAPIPVPATAWLFGLSLGLLGWMRRKKASYVRCLL